LLRDPAHVTCLACQKKAPRLMARSEAENRAEYDANRAEWLARNAKQA